MVCPVGLSGAPLLTLRASLGPPLVQAQPSLFHLFALLALERPDWSDSSRVALGSHALALGHPPGLWETLSAPGLGLGGSGKEGRKVPTQVPEESPPSPAGEPGPSWGSQLGEGWPGGPSCVPTFSIQVSPWKAGVAGDSFSFLKGETKQNERETCPSVESCILSFFFRFLRKTHLMKNIVHE